MMDPKSYILNLAHVNTETAEKTMETEKETGTFKDKGVDPVKRPIPTSKTANKVDMIKTMITKHKTTTMEDLLKSVMSGGNKKELKGFSTLRLGPNFQHSHRQRQN